jgi:Kef-type K+ transport system membrane component KefB
LCCGYFRQRLTTPVGQRIVSILVSGYRRGHVLAAIAALGRRRPEQVRSWPRWIPDHRLIAVIGLGRWLLQPFLGWIVRLDANEVVRAAIFAVLSLAWLGSRAGLSIPGAFLAGVLGGK